MEAKPPDIDDFPSDKKASFLGEFAMFDYRRLSLLSMHITIRERLEIGDP